MREQHISELSALVKQRTAGLLAEASLGELVRLDWLQALVLELLKALAMAIVEAWKEKVLALAEGLARRCPQCGNNRKWKWRGGQEMTISLLGLSFEVPNPYVECGHCQAPGLSVIKLLTNLQSGDSSTELELLAAREGALHSYGTAARELKAHHGQDVERTKVRRMALEIEAQAMTFAEEERDHALTQKLSGPGPSSGWLTVEADGGKVRTGRLQRCKKGDPGYRKKTAKRRTPRRKRPAEWRELITIDVRQPGEVNPRALEVLLPKGAPPGERSRRMRAGAVRAGMGEKTRIQGLGDMGSELAPALLKAFPDRKCLWLADWDHTHTYVKNAAKVLTGLDVAAWQEETTDAIWKRDVGSKDYLLTRAFQFRLPELPPGFDKCPVDALQTYLRNNWPHMQHRFAKANGLPIVSARAECQVRERTKRRFTVPGAWLAENLEPKATLRAIIDAQEWDRFRLHVLNKKGDHFTAALRVRLDAAVQEGRVDADVIRALGQPPGLPVGAAPLRILHPLTHAPPTRRAKGKPNDERVRSGAATG
jgi:hypothetical protein